MTAILETKNVNFSYGKNSVLKDISLTIEKGTLIGVVGPNGSGKTTLAKIFCGLLNPTEGESYLEGKNISLIANRERARQVAYVSQHIEQSSILVKDYIALGRVPYFKELQFFEDKSDFEIIKRAVEFTGIKSLLDNNLSELSGGESQLVGLTRALVQEPNVLILDEPTAYLDMHHQINIFHAIDDLNKKRQLSVVVIVHDINLALQYCDTIVVLSSEGVIQFIGEPLELLSKGIIEKVFHVNYTVQNHPKTHKPYVILHY